MGPGTYEGKEKMVYLPWMSLGTFSELSLLHHFHFNKIGGAGDADGHSGDDDNPVSSGGQA